MSTSDRLREKLARLSPMLQRDILLMLELNRKLPTPYRTWIGIVENATVHEENGKAVIRLTVAVPFADLLLMKLHQRTLTTSATHAS